jgi:muconolactone delta-isomerase
MKILALEHELADATVEQFQKFARDEASRVWELTQESIIRESYFRLDYNEAVLILECESADEAEEVLSSLPFVQNKLIEFEVIPLKAYPGFQRLFENHAQG